MLFKDFQHEQLFQKAKSYFKNLMNYSLTRSFSFIKTWDSLSSEFTADAGRFPSLYLLLRDRILLDPEFQFYLLYVNNLLKYDKARREMGLTNSVIFKILFIMLKKEEMRFDEHSIFKNATSAVPTKRVKSDSLLPGPLTPPLTKPPTTPLPGSHTFPTPKVPLANPLPHVFTHRHGFPADKSFLANKPGAPFITPGQSFPINPVSHASIQSNLGAKVQPHSGLPLFAIQPHMMTSVFPANQMQKIYPQFPSNVLKNFPASKTMNVAKGLMHFGKNPARKPVVPSKTAKTGTLVGSKRKAPSVSRKDKKSSLSRDSISISSSSISFSPDSHEDSRRRSRRLTAEKTRRRKSRKKSHKKKQYRHSRSKYRKHRRKPRESSISSKSSLSSFSESEPANKTLKKFQKSFAEMIQSPDVARLKKKFKARSPSPSLSRSKAKLATPNRKSDTSHDEGEIVDRDRLRTAAKKLKKKRAKYKTKKIKKKRKGESHQPNMRTQARAGAGPRKSDIGDRSGIRIKSGPRRINLSPRIRIILTPAKIVILYMETVVSVGVGLIL